MGIVAAVKKGSWLDSTAVFSSIAGISAPSFFMAILIAYIFGVVLHPYTGLHLTGSWFDIDEVTGETMPSITEPVKKLEPKYDYEEPFSFKEKKGLDGGNF